MANKNKWLIIVGYDTMHNWQECSKQCTVEVSNTNVKLERSAPISFPNRDYSLVLLNTIGYVTCNDYKKVFSNIIKNSDEIIIFCHRAEGQGEGYGSIEKDLDSLREFYPNLQYHLFSGANPDKQRNYPFWLVSEINKLLPNQQLNNWDSAPSWSSLKGKSILSLKWSIARLFLPIDLDLQGLKEAKEKNCFNEYRKQLEESIWAEKNRELLEKARELLYGKGSIKEVVEEKRLKDSDEWREVQKLLPEKDDGGDLYIVKGILENLPSENCIDGKFNEFRQWLNKLIGKLDALIRKVEEKDNE